MAGALRAQMVRRTTTTVPLVQFMYLYLLTCQLKVTIAGDSRHVLLRPLLCMWCLSAVLLPFV